MGIHLLDEPKAIRVDRSKDVPEVDGLKSPAFRIWRRNAWFEAPHIRLKVDSNRNRFVRHVSRDPATNAVLWENPTPVLFR